MASQLKIVIDALWSGKQATQQARSDLQGLERSVEKSGRSFKDYAGLALKAGAALGTLAVAGKQLYDVISEGTELELAAGRFDALAVSIGSTSDAMLGRLREATSGMISDAELMASATDIISLGLAGTEDGVVRLARLVGELGWNMQQVIMTFANDSKMRLDALGLSVTDVEERARKFEAAGMAATEAFDLAVIEAGEAKLELLGSAADTSAGDLKRLEAAWENLRTGLVKEIVANVNFEQIGEATSAIVTLTGNLTRLMTGLENIEKWTPSGALVNLGRIFSSEGFKEWADEVGRNLTFGEQEWAEYNAAIEASQADEIMLRHASAAGELSAGLEEVAEQSGRSFRSMVTEAEAADRVMLGLLTTDEKAFLAKKRLIPLYDNINSELEENAIRTQAALIGLEPLNFAMEDGAEAARLLEEATLALNEATTGYFESLRAGTEIDYAAVLYEAALASGISAEAAADLLVAQGELDRTQADLWVSASNLATQTELLGTSWKDAGITADELVIAYDGLMSGTYSTAEAAIAAMIAQRDYNEALEETPEEVETEVILEDDDANTGIRGYKDMLEGIPSYVRTDVVTVYSSSGTPGTGGTVFLGEKDREFASGTDGWMTVPGAIGAPYPVVLHGGESFNVVPAGQGGGGGTYVDNSTQNIILQGREATALGMASVKMDRRKRIDQMMGRA